MAFPTLNEISCCLNRLKDQVGELEGATPSDAITDIAASTATGVNSVGAPTQAEFAALVTAHNTLLANHNSLVTAFNDVLQVLRDHNLIED